MTRINTVPVKELTDQHLFAEYREMPRMVSALHKSLNRKSGPLRSSEIPLEYVLGKGHMKFFMDKFAFLKQRYEALVTECQARSINISNTDSSIFDNVPKVYYNNYTPDAKALALCRERINEKIAMRPSWYRYYGEPYDRTRI